MNFKVACPHCGQRIGAAEADIGTLGGCPRCEQQFVVPAPEAPAPLEAAPPAVEIAPELVAEEVAIPPAPEVEPVTKRGAAIGALVLSILPVLNLVGLGLAIYAVVRSDRPGRSGDAGQGHVRDCRGRCRRRGRGD